MIEIIKAIFFGIVEGITEWLPISSTGHMIILDEFVKLNVREEFWNLFLVVIQLGAILAVVLLFWNQIFPLNLKDKKEPVWKKDILFLWVKILVACVPAGIVGVLFDDVFDKYLYNFPCVAMALIVFGILFIIVEKKKKGTTFRITSIDQLDYKTGQIPDDGTQLHINGACNPCGWLYRIVCCVYNCNKIPDGIYQKA